MKKHILKIRMVNQRVFNAIKNGTKTIETRAAKPKYQKIKIGDNLEFICGGKKLTKKVKTVKHFATIDALLKIYHFKQIMPFAGSINEAKKIWYSFPNYKKLINQFGLIVLELKVYGATPGVALPQG